MTQPLDERLYQLLPAVYRRRDADLGQPLRALLAVMEQPLRRIELDIQQLHDNWFIETCADWLVPYIGDLLGVRLLHSNTGDGLTLRAFVANTLGFRRRKGTTGLLERVSQDVTGWPAAAVEYFQRLATTQNVNHVRPGALATVHVGRRAELERLGGPFETAPYNVDIRSIASGRGRPNIRNIGIFLWTFRSLKAERVVPAPAADAGGPGFYRVNPLGQDQAMWNPRQTSERLDVRQSPDQVPEPLSRFVLYKRLSALRAGTGDPNDAAAIKQIFEVTLNGVSVDPTQIAICNLSTWHRPVAVVSPPTSPPTVFALAIDPLLGRIALPTATSPTVQVTYFYGAPADIGGGVYLRPPADDGIAGSPPPAVTTISGGGTINAALVNTAVSSWAAGNGTPKRVVIEIGDSLDYTLGDFAVADDVHLEIRAARSGPKRPLLQAATSAPVNVTLGTTAGHDTQLTFEGLWIAAGLRVTGVDAALITLTHCTLVPGVNLAVPASPPASPPAGLVSLQSMNDNDVRIAIRHSIMGPLLASSIAGSVTVEDSILDAVGATVTLKAAQLSTSRATVLGATTAKSIGVVEDSIFTGVVTVERTQDGCPRFCFLPDGSHTPRQFRCQPQMALAALGPSPSANDRNAELARVRPKLSSQTYGTPDYARLSPSCPDEIARGGSGESEMGAYQSLQIPARNANLQAALDEYLRFGLEAGTFPAVRSRRTS